VTSMNSPEAIKLSLAVTTDVQTCAADGKRDLC